MTVPVTRALFVTKEKLHCLPSSMALLRENRSRDKLLQKSLFESASQFQEGVYLIKKEAPINVRFRIWFLITAARIEFVLPSLHLISVNTYVLNKTCSSLKGFQTSLCKSDHESEPPFTKISVCLRKFGQI